MLTSNILSRLRRALLIKVISRQAPSRADVASVIELTASKVVEALQAQSIVFYLVDGNQILTRQVYYSPTLWAHDPSKEHRFIQASAELMAQKLPRGRGIVGRVIESGEPVFYRDTESKAPFMASLTESAGFEIYSTLTVPLKSTITLGAIQVLNKELAAGTNGEFTEADLAILQEVAEYSSTLIHRMVDPRYHPNADDAARFISRLTELPLVGKAEDIEIDVPLIESIGDDIIRREGVFPYKRLDGRSVAVVMTNPLDYSRREMFSRATELSIDEVSVVSASLFDLLLKKHFKEGSGNRFATEDVNIGAVAEVISSTYAPLRSSEISVADLEREDSAPIIQLTNRIIEDAYICG